jgi:hypothetical protein
MKVARFAAAAVLLVALILATLSLLGGVRVSPGDPVPYPAGYWCGSPTGRC